MTITWPQHPGNCFRNSADPFTNPQGHDPASVEYACVLAQKFAGEKLKKDRQTVAADQDGPVSEIRSPSCRAWTARQSWTTSTSVPFPQVTMFDSSLLSRSSIWRSWFRLRQYFSIPRPRQPSDSQLHKWVKGRESPSVEGVSTRVAKAFRCPRPDYKVSYQWLRLLFVVYLWLRTCSGRLPPTSSRKHIKIGPLCIFRMQTPMLAQSLWDTPPKI